MIVATLIIVGGYCTQWLGEFMSIKRTYLRLPIIIRGVFLAGTTLMIIIFSARDVEQFIYFRF